MAIGGEMKLSLKGGVALCLMLGLFVPAIIADADADASGRKVAERGDLNRLSSNDGDDDAPTRVEGGVEPVVEVFADRRGLQGRFDEDGSAGALRRKRRDDEGSDEDDDGGGNPDEDEDGDVTPIAP